MLTARAAAAVSVDFEVVFVDVHLDVRRLGKHRHRHGGGVYPALRLRFGHALHAVHPAFEFQISPRALARNHKGEFLRAAELGVVHIYLFHFPAFRVRIMAVHLHKLRAEKRGFVAARPRTDFHNHVVVLVGVLGQQRDAQLRRVVVKGFA